MDVAACNSSQTTVAIDARAGHDVSLLPLPPQSDSSMPTTLLAAGGKPHTNI
jgi:hypothetical protein